MKVSIVIPARNEEENIGYLLNKLVRIFKHINQDDYEIVVVNDNSSDDTPRIIEEFHAKNPRIKPVHRKKNPGFGYTVLEGFKNVSSQNDNDLIIPMCADCSDNPNDLPKLIAKSRKGYDIVYANRVKFLNYPPLKLIFRNLYNKLIKLLFGFKQDDITNFYKAYRYKVFKEIEKNFRLRVTDFSITAELPIKAHLLGFNAAEIPTSWFGRAAEGMGSSKLHLRSQGFRYGIIVFKIFAAYVFMKLFGKDLYILKI